MPQKKKKKGNGDFFAEILKLSSGISKTENLVSRHTVSVRGWRTEEG